MNMLLVNTAILLVRRNLDEQGLNDSVMYTDQNGDNTSLDLLIKKNLPEAINAVHRTVPAYRLEGESALPIASTNSDGVVSFSLPSHVLRIAAFKASDSNIVVTDIIPEASPEGRKQLNNHIRGTYDRPRLVRLQQDGATQGFRYYSMRSNTQNSNLISILDVVYQQSYIESAVSYKVSADLVEKVIAQLTAMVLAILGENDKAQYFFAQAQAK